MKNRTTAYSSTGRQKYWLQRRGSSFLFGFLFLLGIAILAYPSVADYWNSFHQSRAIMSYAESVSNMNAEEYEAIIRAAKAYNRAHCETGNIWLSEEVDQAAYNAQLNYTGNGIMGYITIEKINVRLPIYHGTAESILQTSIGHLEGTSLPVGAESWDSQAKETQADGTERKGFVTDPEDGSHCVVSGHRGLPSAKLFSDLDKMVQGDYFTMNILNETLTYEVDQIRVVEPTDLSELQIVPGMDYCTLVTCTPYGINTHRLLIRGHRVNNAQGDVKVIADALQIEPVFIAPIVAIPMILILVIGLQILLMQRTRKQRSKDALRTTMGLGKHDYGSRWYAYLKRRKEKNETGK